MPERDGFIPGVPCWVDASEPDPEAAVDFYGGLFGWEFRDVMPASAEGSYFIARTETRGWSLFDMSGEPRSGNVAAITSMSDGAAAQPRWNTYISVASADEAATKVQDAGGTAVVEPFDFADAGRTAVFTDAEAAAFCVWEAKKHKGAQVVNDPGSASASRATFSSSRRWSSALVWVVSSVLLVISSSRRSVGLRRVRGQDRARSGG